MHILKTLIVIKNEFLKTLWTLRFYIKTKWFIKNFHFISYRLINSEENSYKLIHTTTQFDLFDLRLNQKISLMNLSNKRRFNKIQIIVTSR